jgi:16S rRNA C1402 (ribose-2'-O) methylase RsmI
MTKKFEEHIRGHAEDVYKILDSRASIKGEFVVVISPKGYTE